MNEFLHYAKSLGPIILAAVAAYLAWRHNKLARELSNDNLQKQLFSEFNARYDNQNDLLQLVLNFSPIEIEEYRNAGLETKFGDYSKAEIKFKINDYFNLCWEEYY